MPTTAQPQATHEYLSPEWLYDTLMGHIEPDLMIANIDTLDEKYAGESEDHRKMREARYELAFLLYDDCLSELDWVLAEDAWVLKQEMKAFAESIEKQDKQRDVQNAHADIHSHDDR